MQNQPLGGDNAEARSIKSENEEIKDDENSIVVTEKEFGNQDSSRPEEAHPLIADKPTPKAQPKQEEGNNLKRSYSKELLTFEEEEYDSYVPTKVQNIIESEKKIQEAYNEIEDEKLGNYEEELKEKIKEKELLVGAIDINELNEEERLIKEQDEIKRQQEREEFQKERQGIATSIQEGVMALYDKEVQKTNEIEEKEREKIRKIQHDRDVVRRVFKSTESKLNNKLVQSKKEIREDYGDLDINAPKARYEMKGQQANTEEISTNDLPQPIMIRIQLLRAVRDKIPNGRYAMLVTIIDRLGSEPIPNLHKKKSNRWKRISKPRRHNGVYYQNELRFEDTLKLDAPCRNEIKSSMAILFELFWLKSKESNLDQVLGWGAFPLVGIDYEINEGKFKIPMIFGEENKALDKFRLIEFTMMQNLDKWLCNMYFHITVAGGSQGKFSISLNLEEDMKKEIEEYERKQEEYRKLEEDKIKANEQSFSINKDKDGLKEEKDIDDKDVDDKEELIQRSMHLSRIP